MIDYKKTELIAECNQKYFQSYATTLDVADFVPEKHIENIHNWILRSMRKEHRRIDKENRKYQRTLRKLIKQGLVVDTTSSEYVLLDIDKIYIRQQTQAVEQQLESMLPPECLGEEVVESITPTDIATGGADFEVDSTEGTATGGADFEVDSTVDTQTETTTETQEDTPLEVKRYRKRHRKLVSMSIKNSESSS